MYLCITTSPSHSLYNYTCFSAHTLSRWLEQDPIELLESERLCIGGVADSLCLEDTPISSIHGVGITNQREMTILWDKLTGVPFYNAIGDYCSGWSLYVIIIIFCSLE